MEASLFYVYGILLYLPIALALSCSLGSRTCEDSGLSTSQSAAPQSKKKKPRKGETGFLPGKCAFCLVCKRYIMRDCDLKTHEEGSSHIDRAQGQDKWYELRDIEEAMAAKKVKEAAKKK